jgi:hypothetical protein
MISKQTVFLTVDRKKAVPEGHKDARYLLVREGSEVEPAQLEEIDGAEGLVGSKRKGPSMDESRTHADAASSSPKAAKKARKASKKAPRGAVKESPDSTVET